MELKKIKLKYELLGDDFVELHGRKSYRIRSLMNFRDVKAGDLGGYISSHYNLSHEGNCWVYPDAKVIDHAVVLGDYVVEGKVTLGDCYTYSDIVDDFVRKFKLISSTKFEMDEKILHRIQAVKDFGDVKKGDIGGYVQYENNLSHNGDCWIYPDAKVMYNAHVVGDYVVKSGTCLSLDGDYGTVKYELTNRTIEFNGRTLYRVRAKKDFGDVKKWEWGGYVEGDWNLSHYGNCWIYNEGKVTDNAIVVDNARVKDHAIIRDNAMVKDHALIRDEAIIMNEACVTNNARVRDYAIVSDKVTVKGIYTVKGDMELEGNGVYGGEESNDTIDNF